MLHTGFIYLPPRAKLNFGMFTGGDSSFEVQVKRASSALFAAFTRYRACIIYATRNERRAATKRLCWIYQRSECLI